MRISDMLRWKSLLLLLFLSVAECKDTGIRSPRAPRDTQLIRRANNAWDLKRSSTSRAPTAAPIFATTTPSPSTTTQPTPPTPGYPQAPFPPMPFPGGFPNGNPFPFPFPFPVQAPAGGFQNADPSLAFPQPGALPQHPNHQPFFPIPIPIHPQLDRYPTAPNEQRVDPHPIGHGVVPRQQYIFGQGYRRVTCRCCCRVETVTPRFRVHCQQPAPLPGCDCSKVSCGSGPIPPGGCGGGTNGCDTPIYPPDCRNRPFDPDCNRVPTQYAQGVDIPPYYNPDGYPGPYVEPPNTYPPDFTTNPSITTTGSSTSVTLTSVLALIIAKILFG